MAIFPKIYKILEIQKEHYELYPWAKYALIEKGYLVVISRHILLKSKLSQYFPEDQCAFAEGMLIDESTLKEMSRASVKEIVLSKEGGSIKHTNGRPLYNFLFAGKRTSENKYTLTNEGPPLTFTSPNYKAFFETAHIKKACPFPHIGLNLNTLNILREGFSFSLNGKKEHNVSIKMVESRKEPAVMFPRDPLLIEPLPLSAGKEEQAIFCPTPLLHLSEAESII